MLKTLKVIALYVVNSLTKTLLKNKASYIELTKEEKVFALTKICGAFKEVRFTILSSIVQILVKYIEPIDQNFIHLIQKMGITFAKIIVIGFNSNHLFY